MIFVHSWRHGWLAGSVCCLGLLGGCGTVAGPIQPLNKGESLVSGSTELALTSLVAASYRYGFSDQMDAALQVGLFGFGGDVRLHPYRSETRSTTISLGAVSGLGGGLRVQSELLFNLHPSQIHARIGPYFAHIDEDTGPYDDGYLPFYWNDSMLGLTAGAGTEYGAFDLRYGWKVSGAGSVTGDINIRGVVYLNRVRPSMWW